MVNGDTADIDGYLLSYEFRAAIIGFMVPRANVKVTKQAEQKSASSAYGTRPIRFAHGSVKHHLNSVEQTIQNVLVS
jgi:hypothetical protein